MDKEFVVLIETDNEDLLWDSDGVPRAYITEDYSDFEELATAIEQGEVSKIDVLGNSQKAIDFLARLGLSFEEISPVLSDDLKKAVQSQEEFFEVLRKFYTDTDNWERVKRVEIGRFPLVETDSGVYRLVKGVFIPGWVFEEYERAHKAVFGKESSPIVVKGSEIGYDSLCLISFGVLVEEGGSPVLTVKDCLTGEEEGLVAFPYPVFKDNVLFIAFNVHPLTVMFPVASSGIRGDTLDVYVDEGNLELMEQFNFGESNVIKECKGERFYLVYSGPVEVFISKNGNVMISGEGATFNVVNLKREVAVPLTPPSTTTDG